MQVDEINGQDEAVGRRCPYRDEMQLSVWAKHGAHAVSLGGSPDVLTFSPTTGGVNETWTG